EVGAAHPALEHAPGGGRVEHGDQGVVRLAQETQWRFRGPRYGPVAGVERGARPGEFPAVVDPARNPSTRRTQPEGDARPLPSLRLDGRSLAHGDDDDERRVGRVLARDVEDWLPVGRHLPALAWRHRL